MHFVITYNTATKIGDIFYQSIQKLQNWTCLVIFNMPLCYVMLGKKHLFALWSSVCSCLASLCVCSILDCIFHFVPLHFWMLKKTSVCQSTSITSVSSFFSLKEGQLWYSPQAPVKDLFMHSTYLTTPWIYYISRISYPWSMHMVKDKI